LTPPEEGFILIREGRMGFQDEGRSVPGTVRKRKSLSLRIPVRPLFFLIAGGTAAAVAVLTVSLHAVRVSLTNPVETLRYE
jgi:hypothetical protein